VGRAGVKAGASISGMAADTARPTPNPSLKGGEYGRAVQVLVEATGTELKRLAFDANLFDRGILITGLTERSSKKRKRILDAIERLQNNDNEEKETSN
jgi:hypothetical protein